VSALITDVVSRQAARELITETLAELSQRLPKCQVIKPGTRPEEYWEYWAGRLEGAAIAALLALEEASSA
jgi:hypothetical protein